MPSATIRRATCHYAAAEGARLPTALRVVPQSMVPRPRFVDLTAVAICTLAWGTTWFVITFQLGVVDPVVSLAYRFALATALLFGWCAVRGLPLRLSVAQHTAARGIGLFTFAIDCTCVYLAEARISTGGGGRHVRYARLGQPSGLPRRLQAARAATRLGGGGAGRRGCGNTLVERDRECPS